MGGTASVVALGCTGKAQEQFSDYPDLLNVNHLSEITGTSKQTVRNLINSGEIRGCRIGRRLYVSKAEFAAYVRRGVNNGRENR